MYGNTCIIRAVTKMNTTQGAPTAPVVVEYTKGELGRVETYEKTRQSLS